jgi:hypothetical protein
VALTCSCDGALSVQDAYSTLIEEYESKVGRRGWLHVQGCVLTITKGVSATSGPWMLYSVQGKVCKNNND